MDGRLAIDQPDIADQKDYFDRLSDRDLSVSFFLAIEPSKKRFSVDLPHNGDRRAEIDVVIENLSHFPRHPDTAMGSGIPRQIALVHTNASGYAHKIRHWCPDEVGARRDWIFTELDIFFDYVAGRVRVVTVEARCVVRIFLDDFIGAGRGIVTLPACGNLRNTNQLVALIEVSSLLV